MSESDLTGEIGIEPQGNRIYLVLDNVPKRAGRIILTNEQATPSRIGTILAIGPDVNRPSIPGGPEPAPLKVGDRVLIGCHSGVNLYLWQYGMSNENWKICTRSEIVAKITKELPKEEEEAEDPMVYATLNRR